MLYGPSKSESIFPFPENTLANHFFRLAYNLSPSFNWKAAMSASEQETYIERLGKLGTLAEPLSLPVKDVDGDGDKDGDDAQK